MPRDVSVTVLDNRSLGGDYFLTTFDAPSQAAEARPGQFLMVGATDPADLLLRRPFSVCLRARGSSGGWETISILFRVVGRGTAFLSRLAAGQRAALLGPLGRGFTTPSEAETPLIVAGGVGIAAFPFFLEELIGSGAAPVVLYGGRTSADLPLLDRLREGAADVEITTDDGSGGTRGLVTGPLTRRLEQGAGPYRVYACGPTPMMKKTAEIAARFGVPCEVSLETPMGCGYGVCVGCVVEVRSSDSEYGRYRRVCVDGPVFDAAEIDW
jgi:dihydroorotate dehydrogenase electron transfer subunit